MKKNNFNNKIALIGSGILSKEFAQRAKQLNIETFCFSFDEKDIAVPYVDHYYKINIFNYDEIASVCKENNVSGVIATTELTILPSAEIAERIGALSIPDGVNFNSTND